jgi:hypothetical protein
MDKLKIIGLEGEANGLVVEAQFNPKEISIDKAIPWQRQKGKAPTDLEFFGVEPMVMSCELLFDGFESGGMIQVDIDGLHALSKADSTLKRPPKVKVLWGAENAAGMIPKFEGVIESVGVKYTMFDGDGKPLRATARLRFLEAGNLRAGKPPKIP